MIIYKENSKFLFHRSNLRWPYLDERSLVSYIAGEAGSGTCGVLLRVTTGSSLRTLSEDALDFLSALISFGQVE